VSRGSALIEFRRIRTENPSGRKGRGFPSGVVVVVVVVELRSFKILGSLDLVSQLGGGSIGGETTANW